MSMINYAERRNRLSYDSIMNQPIDENLIKEQIYAYVSKTSDKPIHKLNNQYVQFDEGFYTSINEMFCVFIANNKCTHNQIDIAYSKKEEEYLKCYAQYKCNYTQVISMYDTITTIYINKLIGIIEYHSNVNDSIIVLEGILKSLHPSLVRFFKKSSNVSLGAFYNKYAHTLKDFTSVEARPIYETYGFIISFCFLSMYYNKSIELDSDVDVMDNFWDYQIYKSEVMESRKILSTDAEHSIRLQIIKDRFEIEQEDCTPYKLYNFIHMVIVDFKDTVSSDFLMALQHLLGDVYTYSGISMGDLMFESLTLEQNNTLLYTLQIIYEYWENSDNMSAEACAIVLISAAISFAVAERYKNTKELYLKECIDEKLDSISLAESNKHLEKQLKSIESKHTVELQKKQCEIELLKAEIQHLNKVLAKNESDTAKCQSSYRDLMDEHTALEAENNELISALQKQVRTNQNTHSEELSTLDMITRINQHKIAICGGHDTLVSQLQSSLHDMISINHSLLLNINALQNVDYVFINTEWFSHALFRTIVPICKKSNIPYFYITGTNFKHVIQGIYNCIESNDSI